ncbi:MAG: elongation factor P maturation arginine rhamnosyltransferase EarP [Proteobacteria bacterium]|nr:elongation factor P maturation arginine rhamnosyltransferase EarP [Pseudomonadota bacterium]MCL2308177.1 elongation factor P maturation arginine rhamnosyltransferase EarP [Pseudomonadota bacterium]
MSASWFILCRVVDHYGDAGVCWRLARQLAREYDLDVTLFIDDIATLQRLAPTLDTTQNRQRIDCVTVQQLTGQLTNTLPPPAFWPEVIIDAFGGGLPPSWLEALARDFPLPSALAGEGSGEKGNFSAFEKRCDLSPPPSAQTDTPLSPRGRGVGGEGEPPSQQETGRLLQRARELRKQQTPHEQALWQQLRAKRFSDYKFRRQQPLGCFIVDFVCFPKRLIIELDGGQHADSAEYDAQRDAWLTKEGFRVLRFWNNEWAMQQEAVLETIWNALQEPPPLPNHSPARGEGLLIPHWIVLEYLSAEPWIETMHGLASPPPSIHLPRHFFFPGFTETTGGLLREKTLIDERDAFQHAFPDTRRAFLKHLGIDTLPPDALLISLFCYDTPALPALLDAWSASPSPIVCLIPETVAPETVQHWRRRHHIETDTTPTKYGALTLHTFPFLPQDDYDRLLWSCDLNFVRGEDSFVRAQWAAQPFVWQAYRQNEQAHLAKVDAFLKRTLADAPDHLQIALSDFTRAWNDEQQINTIADTWRSLAKQLPAFRKLAHDWAEQQTAQTDLAQRLTVFCGAL